MAANTDRAMKRLMGRLSAMRQTLRKDERDLLDKLILGATAAEVEAHKIKPKNQPAAAKRLTARNTPEVQGHKVDLKHADKQAAKRVMPRNLPEVEGHAMTPKVTPKVTPAVAKRIQPRFLPDVDWDPDKKVYRVVLI